MGRRIHQTGRRVMTTDELAVELQANKINENVCLILPVTPVEGALCLVTRDSEWNVILNERGEYLIDESFASEDAACRFFLKEALLEPTFRKDFTASSLSDWPQRKKEIIKKYGFEASN